jgi:hypothetical protein
VIRSTAELHALVRTAELEPAMARLERCLEDMSQAMSRREAQPLEATAALLQRTLSHTLADFQRAARQQAVPADLRRRLILAAAQVAAQREALARATASMDRAIEAMLPQAATAAATSVYNAQAGHGLRSSGACLSA